MMDYILPDGAPGRLLALGLALLLGLLIGIERGWSHRDDASGSRVAGIRTFGILGLLGGVAGQVPALPGAIAVLAGAGMLLAGYARQRQTGNVSATSALVGLLTLLLGYLAASGHHIEALAAAVATTLLLSMRNQIHGWLRGLTAQEVQAIGRFALLSAVILPLLPDVQLGPLDAWNPRKIWLVVVFVSGLSLLGYVATRKLGPRAGLLATAFTGALVSSTAVTVSLARRLHEGSAEQGNVTAGIALASAVMFLRVTILAAVLTPFALVPLVILMMPAALVAILLAGLALARADLSGGEADGAALGNPFDLRPALALAALVALLALGVRWAQIHYGDAGLTLLLALTGLADVDAAVLSLSTLPPGSLAPHAAGLALVAPILLNTAFKGVLAIVACPGRRGVRAALPLFAAVAASLLSIVFL